MSKPKTIAYYEVNDPLPPKLWIGKLYDAFITNEDSNA